jgi:diadenosine tetraphosphate (Ap4A) HIT family hydrolase
MTPVIELDHSIVYLFHDQRYVGRCIVACKQHVQELHELDAPTLQKYMADVAAVSKSIQQVTGCQKINYAAYGDLVSHLHFHLVPKSPDAPHWGSPFITDIENPTLLDPACFTALKDQLAESIRAHRAS